MKFYSLASLLVIPFSFAYAIPSDVSMTLDQYLKLKGFSISPTHSKTNEGYMSPAQQQQFNKQLATYHNIATIAEIGLNAGHNAENFFQECKTITKFVSFDLRTCIHDL